MNGIFNWTDKSSRFDFFKTWEESIIEIKVTKWYSLI